MHIIIIILSILFIHWVADFVFQPEEWARKKSSEWAFLLLHTIIYSMIWIFPLGAYIVIANLKSPLLLLFIPITFICHTATDYYTSRVNKQLWDNKDVHGFFVSVGFDQFLHFTQLILTFYFLTK